MSPSAAGETRAAWTAGVSCYLMWGFLPLAMQAMAGAGAGAWEIMAHRVVWGGLAAGVFVLAARQGGHVLKALREPKTLAVLALSSALIAANWITFIWAASSGRVLQTALGYYTIPLVSVAAGAIVFREKIDGLAKIAIALAVVGVAAQGLALGRLPWVSLVLAASFGGYGIVRKMAPVEAQSGLFIECLMMAGPGLAFIGWLVASGGNHFLDGAAPTFWLIMAGPITAVPLAMFSWAARRLPLSAMGFLQFLAPSIAFIIGVIQGEPFGVLHAVSFACIWTGAAVFIFGVVRAAKRVQRLA
jgi:chloramphenicol-sensitive protein RarD